MRIKILTLLTFVVLSSAFSASWPTIGNVEIKAVLCDMEGNDYYMLVPPGTFSALE
jgi:hypothetical protein